MNIYDIAARLLVIMVLGFFFVMALRFSATIIKNIRDKDYMFALCSVAMTIVCLSFGILGVGFSLGDIKAESNKCERCIK